MLDRTVRSNNWIRSDTIFIESEQIEALSNRPAWIKLCLNRRFPESLQIGTLVSPASVPPTRFTTQTRRDCF